ncbi:hypothetical protein GBAR_LOCUS19807, partial [Geodia barretti]
SHTRQGSSPAVTPPPPPTQLPRSVGAARGTGTGGGAVTPGVSAGAGAGATGGPIRRGGGIGRGKARVRRGALTSPSSSSINRPCSYPYRRSSTPHLQPPPQPPLADKPTLLLTRCTVNIYGLLTPSAAIPGQSREQSSEQSNHQHEEN